MKKKNASGAAELAERLCMAHGRARLAAAALSHSERLQRFGGLDGGGSVEVNANDYLHCCHHPLANPIKLGSAERNIVRLSYSNAAKRVFLFG